MCKYNELKYEQKNLNGNGFGMKRNYKKTEIYDKAGKGEIETREPLPVGNYAVELKDEDFNDLEEVLNMLQG